jgi:hypothetical protein
MENGELATKKDLAEMGAILNKDLAEMEARLDAKLDAKLEVLGDRLTELIRDVETRLLTSFHGYGKGQSARMHLLEVSDSTTAQRLAALEERVLNLETYRGPGSH